MEDKLAEVLDKLDMLQSYVQHLGDRIDIVMRIVRRSASSDIGPPPLDGSRKQRLMQALMD